MAFVVDDLIIAAIIVSAASGVAGAVQTKKAGDFQEASLKKQAKDEESQARERELARKTKINKVLAAQITGLGASGISAEGSPQLIATESLRQESLGDLAGTASRIGRRDNLLAQGRAARQLGNLSAGTQLLSTVANTAMTATNLSRFD